MNSKKAPIKNQDLFSFIFKDQEFTNPNQFQIPFASNFKEDTAKMLSESNEHNLDADTFAEFQLSMDVGINFFYFAFIKVFSYQKRRQFLDYQFDQAKDKMTFLHRVESLSQCNYWYVFGENSHYNPETEKEVGDWLLEKYTGNGPKKSTLNLIKP